MDLISLDEDGVCLFLKDCGFPYYDQQIKENNISGLILIHLDHEALKDLGIHSVGQRLAILRAVYEAKVQQNIPIEAEHYVPPTDQDGRVGSDTQGMTPAKIFDMLNERDDRIRSLEMEVQKIHEMVQNLNGKEEPHPARPIGLTAKRSMRSPTTNLFLPPHPLSSNALNRAASTSRRLEGLPDSPGSPLESPLISTDLDQQTNHLADMAVSFDTAGPAPISPTSAHHGPDPHTFSSMSHAKDSHSRPRDRDREKDNPYRHFKVSVDDPCYRVLPAALKKYKINDDWRQYALFICYTVNGQEDRTVDRCLSYDEKPLSLFQKLKESNANPVFMLRHFRDIKSPLVVATTKQNSRKEKRDPKAGQGLDKPPSTDRTGAPLMLRRTRLHYPPVLLPLGGQKTEEDDTKPPPPSPRDSPGYSIGVYPYLSEREDEFDVGLGDAFLIAAKSNGWWLVHRDLGPTATSTSSESRKCGWVPAGCLLEISVAPLSLPGANLTPGILPNARDVIIDPQQILSSSTAGIALMDYARNGPDELDLKVGMTFKVLKRYCHWMYVVKDDGTRGWIPSWFCGRPSKDKEKDSAANGLSPHGVAPSRTTSVRKTASNGALRDEDHPTHI